jgi:hypothetical protein
MGRDDAYDPEPSAAPERPPARSTEWPNVEPKEHGMPKPETKTDMARGYPSLYHWNNKARRKEYTPAVLTAIQLQPGNERDCARFLKAEKFSYVEDTNRGSGVMFVFEEDGKPFDMTVKYGDYLSLTYADGVRTCFASDYFEESYSFGPSPTPGTPPYDVIGSLEVVSARLEDQDIHIIARLNQPFELLEPLDVGGGTYSIGTPLIDAFADMPALDKLAADLESVFLDQDSYSDDDGYQVVRIKDAAKTAARYITEHYVPAP